MFGYVYETINSLNNKKYIGQKKGNFNENYKGSGIHLKSAFLKQGKHNFTVKVLAIANSRNELNELEIFHIKERNAVLSEDYYNLASGGNAWGSTKTKETREKISKATKGRRAYNKGIPNPEQSKRMKENNPMKNKEISTRAAEKRKGKPAWNKGLKKNEPSPLKGKRVENGKIIAESNIIQKICIVCSKDFSVIYKERSRITCGKSCAATYSNLKRAGKWLACVAAGGCEI